MSNPSFLEHTKTSKHKIFYPLQIIHHPKEHQRCGNVVLNVEGAYHQALL
jgi:hypothetical protein